MNCHLCCVTDKLKDVVRGVLIPWKPYSESITVSTNSTAGSYEVVGVFFYDQDDSNAGDVLINNVTPIP